MSVASRTPSRIGIITLRSTIATDWSSFSVSQRLRRLIGRKRRPTLREANRHGTKTRDQRRSNNNPGRRFHLTPHNNAEC